MYMHTVLLGRGISFSKRKIYVMWKGWNKRASKICRHILQYEKDWVENQVWK